MADYAQGTVSVTTTATKVATVEATNDGILVKNQGTVVVYFGGPTVTADETATGGFPLAAGESVSIPTVGNTTRDLYAIVASGTASVSFLQPKHD